MGLIDYASGDRELFRTSTLGETINFLLALLILLSYVPQYLRIRIHRPKVDGISPLCVLFRSVYATACLANILVLPATFKRQQRCREERPTGKCMAEMMDIWQFTADWIGSHIIFILCLYQPSNSSLNSTLQPHQGHRQDGSGPSDQRSAPIQLQEQQSSSWQVDSFPFRLAIIFGAFIEAILLIPSVFFAINPRIEVPGYYILVQLWSFGMVEFSAFFTLIYSLPQLYHTWDLGRVGSLSLSTITIQIPVYFLVATSLAVQYGKLENVPILGRWFAAWNPWISLIIKGFQEGLLLALCIYVYKKPDSTSQDSDPTLDETTPLLSDRQGGIEQPR